MMCWYRSCAQNSEDISGGNTAEEEGAEEGIWKSLNVREVVWRGTAEENSNEVDEDVSVHLAQWLVEGE